MTSEHNNTNRTGVSELNRPYMASNVNVMMLRRCVELGVSRLMRPSE